MHNFFFVCPRPLILTALLVLSSFFGLPAQASELFPKPPELERDVNFWIRVYTEVDTNSGYIHDARNLAIVYETLTLSGHRRPDDKAIKSARLRYAEILKRLATDRNDSSADARRVLSLWGPNVTAAQLLEAAGNLRFQRGQSNRFKAGIIRSGAWLDHINTVLAARGLPRELAVLPHVESSFNPEAYSSVGAAGIWQFTRSTGRRYLHIDYVMDERMDPFTATGGAAQLLEHNYQLTSTWPLALTAYNHGASGMRRAARQMGTTDIAAIVRHYKGRSFGFASRNFYVSFLAALEVSENPSRYFGAIKIDPAIDYVEFPLPDYASASSIAKAFNIDTDELKQHNRALLKPVWIEKKRIPKDFSLRIPRSHLQSKPSELWAAIPANERFSEQTADLFHTVVPGDTVSEIASRYGHRVSEIAAMNGLNRRYQIRIGQVLRLPLEGAVVAAVVPATVEPATQLPSVAVLTEVDDAEPITDLTTVDLPTATSIQAPGSDMTADPSDYTVADDNSIEILASETLGHYAEWLDLRASQLRQLNGMPYGRPLVIGNRLKLDFSRVLRSEFERRRLAFAHDLQQNFFMTWQIRSTRKYIVAPGDSLWVLTRREFKVPMWLLRQYNPDLNLDKLQPGTVIIIPELADA